ncbi:MAG: peptide ABC transporter substrate-binding protein [Bifidobacteriaceae bacterium]|jgi:oligopeptide transport system substrate-binding protein|nr:peptide ABC transporter substrate-binding protein [Bifidobacteriaceae bacterium]
MEFRKAIAFVGLLALAIPVAACSGDSPDGGATGGGGGGGKAATQEIVFALHNTPDGIDPTITSNSFASPVIYNTFEGLVSYSTTDGALIPGQAESWDINEDGLTYTFHLREGLKWSDGSALTAGDFVYAAQRVLTPATAAQYVNLYTDYVVGAQELYDDPSKTDGLGIKATDDKTLTVELKAATPFFIDIVGMWAWAPVQQATIEANGDQWTNQAASYVGNGPFKMEEINLGESYVLVKNPNYWDAANVKLEKITFRMIPDPSTALVAFEGGEIEGQLTVPSSDIARLKTSDSGLVVTPAYATTWYNINNTKAPYDNVLVRKALNLAVDRDALINEVLQNGGSPAYSPVAPGYTVDGEEYAEGRSTFDLSPKADPEAAQAALAEAGYPGGQGFPTLQLSYYTDDTTKLMTEALADQLETNLGITVEISNEDWAVYYDNTQAGNYEVGAMGWGADYFHPMTFLQLFKTGDVNNNVFYSNPEYDALVTAAQAETDPVAALDLMRQADAIASAEYPVLSLFYRANLMLVSPDLKGVYRTVLNNLYFKSAYLEG